MDWGALSTVIVAAVGALVAIGRLAATVKSQGDTIRRLQAAPRSASQPSLEALVQRIRHEVRRDLRGFLGEVAALRARVEEVEHRVSSNEKSVAAMLEANRMHSQNIERFWDTHWPERERRAEERHLEQERKIDRLEAKVDRVLACLPQ